MTASRCGAATYKAFLSSVLCSSLAVTSNMSKGISKRLKRRMMCWTKEKGSLWGLLEIEQVYEKSIA